MFLSSLTIHWPPTTLVPMMASRQEEISVPPSSSSGLLFIWPMQRTEFKAYCRVIPLLWRTFLPCRRCALTRYVNATLTFAFDQVTHYRDRAPPWDTPRSVPCLLLMNGRVSNTLGISTSGMPSYPGSYTLLTSA